MTGTRITASPSDGGSNRTAFAASSTHVAALSSKYPRRCPWTAETAPSAFAESGCNLDPVGAVIRVGGHDLVRALEGRNGLVVLHPSQMGVPISHQRRGFCFHRRRLPLGAERRVFCVLTRYCGLGTANGQDGPECSEPNPPHCPG